MSTRETLKKARRVRRRAFDKLANDLETALKEDKAEAVRIQSLKRSLEEKYEEIRKIDTQIFEGLLEEDAPEDILLQEQTQQDEAVSRFNFVTSLMNNVSKGEDKDSTSDSKKSSSSNSSENSKKRRFKLPPLEIRKFNGELKDWVPFWAQFKKIDDDTDIDDGDKFQYLVQSTAPGSRARRVVEAFPPSSENYKKALQALKERFGREEVLIEVYVRELLALIVSNSLQGSPKRSLTTLHDQLEAYLRALETLDVSSDCSAMLYPMVESCLPEHLIREWQRRQAFSFVESDEEDTQGKDKASKPQTSKSKLRKLRRFIKAEVEGEELISLAVSGLTIKNKTKPMKESEIVPTAAELVATSSQPSHACVFCEGEHPAAKCLKKLTLEQKKQLLSRRGHCFRCLKYGHMSKACRAKLNCDKCQRNHLTTMCYSPSEKEQAPATVDNALTNITTPQVVLQTLAVRLKSKDGTMERVVKVFLDTGSQRSYVLEETARALGYSKQRTEPLVHTLFGGHRTTQVTHGVYRIHVSNIDRTYHCNFEVLGQTKICDYVGPSDLRGLIHETERSLFPSSQVEAEGSVEILIGADLLGKLLTGKQRELSSGLVGIETRLGWSMIGKIENEPNESVACGVTTSCLSMSQPLTKLWDLDTIGIRDPCEKKIRSQQLAEVNEFFLNTTRRDNDGRYVIRLPMKSEHPPLPDNLTLAEKRTRNKSNKMREQGRLKEYAEIFEEWLQDGIVEKCSSTSNEPCHYLPHRPVYKEESTTKIRPVFDASARLAPNFPALNDCLETGENLIEMIPSILLRFRLNKIGVTADIRRAFLQIVIAPEDRDLLRFIWFDQNDERIIFRHCRVVFGLCCSPFLLGATLNNLFEKEAKECATDDLPFCITEVNSLKKAFYVDNFVASINSEEDLKTVKAMATKILSLAKFELRGWESTELNKKEETNDNPDSKILGMIWDRFDDSLRICPNGLKGGAALQITKRTLLSVAQRIFDPIGFCCPATLQPKILLQEAWKRGVSWDEPLPDDLSNQFRDWYEKLTLIFGIRIPRRAFFNKPGQISIHTFVDASKNAYAAAVFVRNETKEGVSVHLVAAKSRVSPLKELTIPRLELLGATIGSRLFTLVTSSLEIEATSYFWTDSSTVLAWIQRKELWTPFVKNRIEEIRQTTKSEDWRHVPGQLNPADLPSRGCDPKMLKETKWWEGPEWLKSTPEEWPVSKPTIDEEEVLKERRKTTVSFVALNKPPCIEWTYRYFSQYVKIVRMISWIRRFAWNCKHQQKRTGEITAEEFASAETWLLQAVQRGFLRENNNPSGLSLFQDTDGTYRVRTQIIRREDSEDFRCPVILPPRHPIVIALIRHSHLENHHLGVQGLMTKLRERFWIQQARKTIRSVVHACIICRRFQSRPANAPISSLPAERVRDAEPFEVVGIDFAGPIYLRGGEKAWICLFTCALVRALHLELVSDLSTKNFILALRRFIARRGRPTIIYTDNGTNFVGAANALNGVNWSEVERFGAERKIEWKFIPPSAPWWGGWWERLVGIMKQLLRRTLGRASLAREEMITLLQEAESIINNRPLTYVSEDVADLTPLTPSLFLQGPRANGVPDLDHLDAACLNRRARYRLRLKQELWQRFRSEYLSTLAHHTVMEKPRRLREGEMVLVASDNKKRLEWPLARVIELLPGVDGEVRVVRLRTATGVIVRPVQRLHPLEIQQEDTTAINGFERSHPEGRRVGASVTDVFEKSHPQESPGKVNELSGEQCQPKTRITRAGRVVRVPDKLDL